jgi:hypothetical protein
MFSWQKTDADCAENPLFSTFLRITQYNPRGTKARCNDWKIMAEHGGLMGFFSKKSVKSQ